MSRETGGDAELDAVEAEFLIIQRQRFRDLLRDAEQTRSVILKLMSVQNRVYGSYFWETFRETGAWETIQAISFAEDQFKFAAHWKKIQKQIQEDSFTDSSCLVE